MGCTKIDNRNNNITKCRRLYHKYKFSNTLKLNFEQITISKNHLELSELQY